MRNIYVKTGKLKRRKKKIDFPVPSWRINTLFLFFYKATLTTSVDYSRLLWFQRKLYGVNKIVINTENLFVPSSKLKFEKPQKKNTKISVPTIMCSFYLSINKACDTIWILNRSLLLLLCFPKKKLFKHLYTLNKGHFSKVNQAFFSINI